MDTLPSEFLSSICCLSCLYDLHSLTQIGTWSFTSDLHLKNRRNFRFYLFHQAEGSRWYFKQGMRVSIGFSDLNPQFDRINSVAFLNRLEFDGFKGKDEQLEPILKALCQYIPPNAFFHFEGQRIQQIVVNQNLFLNIKFLNVQYSGKASEALLASDRFENIREFVVRSWPQEASDLLHKFIFKPNLQFFRVYGGTCKFGFDIAKHFIDDHIDSSTSCDFGMPIDFNFKDVLKYRSKCQKKAFFSIFKKQNTKTVNFKKIGDKAILRVKLRSTDKNYLYGSCKH